MINSFHIAKISSSYIFQLANLSLITVFSTTVYGKLALIISVSQFILSLTSGLTSGAMNVFASKKFALIGSCNEVYIYRLIVITINIIAIFLIYSTYCYIYEIPIFKSENSKLIIILTLGYIMYEVGCNFLYPTIHFKIQGYIELIISIIFITLVLFCVREIKDYVTVFFVVGLVSLILSSGFYISRYYNVKFNFDVHEFNDFIKYSAWQSVSVISIYFVNYGTNYVMFHNEISEETIGVFNFTLRLFFGMSAIFALIVILMPKFIREGRVNIRNINAFSSKIILIIALVYMGAALLFFAALLVLDRHEYMLSILYMAMLLPAFVAMSYVNITNTYLANTTSYKSAQITILFQALILMIVSSVLISYIGIFGLIISYTMSYMLVSIYTFFNIKNNIIGNEVL